MNALSKTENVISIIKPVPKHALVVEDDSLQAQYLQEALGLANWKASLVSTGKAAMELLNNRKFEVVLLDICLPDINGVDLLKDIQRGFPELPVIAMTGLTSTELTVEAMRNGAYDFLQKPITQERLQVTLGNAYKHHQLTHALNSYQKNFQRDHFHNIIGSSLPIQSLFRIIESSAPSKATVFILGESGTGKELCAEALHKQSPRHDKPFVTLNCAAIPKELMESEIFGHVKGAFTGATDNRDGAATRANGGTLFLDEICEMDLELQSKLLRFFQYQRFQKVGGKKEEEVDVRFVCATNKDPFEQVKAGFLREDLFYRLHVIPLSVPPLRERGKDILMLANYFLARFSQEEKKSFQEFSAEVEKILNRYNWPGNVRELQNIIRNIVVLNDARQVDVSMLPPALLNCTSVANGAIDSAVDIDQAETIVPLWRVEMEAIERAISLCNGNVHKAAELLDINPSTIYRKRKRWQQLL